MSTLQEILLLSLAFGGVGMVWWADRVMEQADEELSAFAQRADWKLGA